MQPFVPTILARKPQKWRILFISLLATCACLLPGFSSVAQAKPLPTLPGIFANAVWAGVTAMLNPPADVLGNMGLQKGSFQVQWVSAQ
jgi:hypothetical protein